MVNNGKHTLDKNWIIGVIRRELNPINMQLEKREREREREREIDI